jgi:hypothetical protein
MERMTSQGWKSTVTGNSLAPLPCEKFTKGKVKSVGKEKEKDLVEPARGRRIFNGLFTNLTELSRKVT